MIIDDDPQVAEILSLFLSQKYNVVTLHTAQEALSRLEQEKFDLIFCDLSMPEMDGIDFFEQFKQKFPTQVSTIIFITGGATSQRYQDFCDSIPNLKLEKPFSLKTLLPMVQKLVQV